MIVCSVCDGVDVLGLKEERTFGFHPLRYDRTDMSFHIFGVLQKPNKRSLPLVFQDVSLSLITCPPQPARIEVHCCRLLLLDTPTKVE